MLFATLEVVAVSRRLRSRPNAPFSDSLRPKQRPRLSAGQAGRWFGFGCALGGGAHGPKLRLDLDQFVLKADA
jgi:hypothetical protein